MLQLCNLSWRLNARAEAFLSAWKGPDWVALRVTHGLTLKTTHAASAFQAATFSQAPAGFLPTGRAASCKGTGRDGSGMFNTSNHGAKLSCGLIQPGHFSAISLSNPNIFLVKQKSCCRALHLQHKEEDASSQNFSQCNVYWQIRVNLAFFSFTAEQKCLAQQPANFLPNSFQGTPL